MSVVGGELTTPDRIKYIQGQMRIAIQNHQVLWQRILYKTGGDTEAENMLKMLQAIILSLGRRQTELMVQYQHDLRLKYPGDTEMQSKVSLTELGWPDRDEPVRKHVPNGSGSDPGRRPPAQVVRRPNVLGRPTQKMTSLLKPPTGNSNQLLQRKESERLKAAAAKQAEVAAPVITKKLLPGQKPKIVLKVAPAARRVSNEKLSDSDSFPELKESELAGYKLTPQDKVTDVADLSQDQYLEVFGLVHKDKSKTMVVNQTKRKRRTAAGHSDFYKDFFQPKRPYNRKTQMTDVESPSNSQEIAEVDSEVFSPPSEKPSVPPSPASSCSTDVVGDATPRVVSPVLESSESLGAVVSQSDDAAKTAEPEFEPEDSVESVMKSIVAAACANEVPAGESLTTVEPAASKESPVASAEIPLLAGEPSTEETVAAESQSSSAEPLSSTEPLPSTEELPAEGFPSIEGTPSTTPESSADAPADVDLATNEDSQIATQKTDSEDGKTPLDESAPPSPTNEDDEEGDSSLSPSDLLDTETNKIPSADPPGKVESVSSVGEESCEAGMDISAMIGENVRFFSADGADDCSEMVNRYRLDGQSDESEDSDPDGSEEDTI